MEADIAIIGGGYYGCAAALELQSARPDLNIVILERETTLFSRASSTNQGQLHLGYLYSKFPQVAQECTENVQEFMYHYAAAINQDNTVYYAIHRDSEINPKDYEAFCATIGLPLERVNNPSKDFFGPSLVAVYKTAEKTFSNATLQQLIQEQLIARSIKTRTTFAVDTVQKSENDFVVTATNGNKIQAHAVINAAFADSNTIHERSDFPMLPLEHAVYLDFLIDLPKDYYNIGLSVVRGRFAALASTKKPNASHILASGKFRVIQAAPIFPPVEAITQKEVNARYQQAIQETTPYITALRSARLKGYSLGTRTNYTDPATGVAASRAVVLKDYAGIAGYHCVFGGKVTCIPEISDPLHEIAQEI